MNIEEARINMIKQQIRPWGVLAPEVLDLLLVVRREDFVPDAYAHLAFSDTEIPLPCGENMLTPLTEARILKVADVKKHENVLEIGTGSGYMAALLADRARHVTTLEIEPTLKELAVRNLKAYGVTNVDVVLADGAQGWAAGGQFDVIVISGSLPVLPEAFLQQIKIGGRIMATIGEAPVMSAQVITRVSDSSFETSKLFETCIKPLRHAQTPSHFKF
ncbi:MAG TPA: protein-L-isoaspartate O-methyltransferase [Burkholderiaceae bacterium]|jgi:protein-L-isoaspartate(D-aspartate) O-methyltransferase|nr:protein-L-isoaspartate O-methyltransferase [Burkholderiaceae bacterium]